MNKLFLTQMYFEENANAHKGNWNNWHPHPHTWLWEMQHHLSKLQRAIQKNDKKLIKEHSADLGLYAEKSFVKYGLSSKDRISRYSLMKALRKPSFYELNFSKDIKID